MLRWLGKLLKRRKKCSTCNSYFRLPFTIDPFPDEWSDDSDIIVCKSTMCQKCSTVYCAKNSICCSRCGGSILPGTPVGLGPDIGIGKIYAHYTEECYVVGSYVGVWMRDVP